jgi:hypothetical protein
MLNVRRSRLPAASRLPEIGEKCSQLNTTFRTYLVRPRMQTFGIGAVAFEIPDFLDARDDDGTLVAYPPETDYANVRFTVSTVVKEGKPAPGAAERFIREKVQNAFFTTASPSCESIKQETVRGHRF